MAAPSSELSPDIQAILDRVDELVPEAAHGVIDDKLDVEIRKLLFTPLSPEFHQLMDKVNKLDPGPNEYMAPEVMWDAMRSIAKIPAQLADAEREYQEVEEALPFPLLRDPPTRDDSEASRPSSNPTTSG